MEANETKYNEARNENDYNRMKSRGMNERERARGNEILSANIVSTLWCVQFSLSIAFQPIQHELLRCVFISDSFQIVIIRVHTSYTDSSYYIVIIILHYAQAGEYREKSFTEQYSM